MTAALVMALLAVLGSAEVMLANESNAPIEGDYGEVYEIDLAPGFSYTYTPTYPADLDVTTTILDYEDEGIDASIDGSTISVSVKNGVTSGSYDLIIQAQTNTGGLSQTAYQHIRFNVVSGLVVTPGQVINDIIAGASVNFVPQASSGMDTVTWAVKGELPAGLSFDGTTVIGTPTQIGLNTLTLTASAKGQTQDLTVTFTVYNVIVDNADEIIFSNGNTVSSTAIAQTGSDLGVTWAVTDGTLPEGFSLDAATGVISGSSTILQETVITITGTAANGPAQSITKQITIRSEPELVLSPSGSILTYVNNQNPVTSSVAATQTSVIEWQVTGYDGATVSDGIVSVTNPSTAGMGQTLTVTATTQYGQSKTAHVILDVEDTLTISGDSELSAIAGTAELSAAFTIDGGSGNELSAHTDVVGLTSTIQDGCLSVLSASPMQDSQVTVTVTSAAGQTASTTVTVDVYNVLVFSSQPTGGAVIYPM